MKNTKRTVAIIIAVFAVIIGIVCGFIIYGNQPRQYLARTYGVQIPERIKIESLHDEPGWDSRLSYGTLRVPKDNHDGLVNTRNFEPLSDLKDARVPNSEVKDVRIPTLIHDVNEAFGISKVTVSSKDIQYQRITVKDDSILVIFYNAKTHEYCFYAARYTIK